MKLVLAYDTETTGLPDWHQPSDAPHQPHLVQLGGILVDLDSRKEMAVLDLVVKPNGWTIPAEVSAIHGITQEMAMDIGVNEALAVDTLLDLWAEGARDLIGHNESFDRRILRIAIKRYIDNDDRADGRDPVCSDRWKAGSSICTQLLSTPILKLPPTAKMKAARRNHHKSANLGEAYEFFTGKPLVGAHSAIVDCRAALAVYFAIQDGITERVVLETA